MALFLAAFLSKKMVKLLKKKRMATKKEELHSNFYETYPLIQIKAQYIKQAQRVPVVNVRSLLEF
jgi:hypothetical protein